MTFYRAHLLPYGHYQGPDSRWDALRLIHLTFPRTPKQINRYLPPRCSSNRPSCPADGKPATTGAFKQIHGCSSSTLLVCSLDYEIKLFGPAVLAKPGQLWHITLGRLWLPPSWLLVLPVLWHHVRLERTLSTALLGRTQEESVLAFHLKWPGEVQKVPFLFCTEEQHSRKQEATKSKPSENLSCVFNSIFEGKGCVLLCKSS